MSVEETIRKLIKEELEAQLDEINEKLSSVSSRIDAIEGEMSKKWGLMVNLRKYTLDQLMMEYSKLKSELFPKNEALTENAEV
jgi:ribosomal protein L29